VSFNRGHYAVIIKQQFLYINDDNRRNVFAVAARRRNASRRRQRYKPIAKKTDKKTHEDWLREADYSCIRAGRTVTPPVVINARHTTIWATYDGRPRLYTTYRCKWGYVARPAHSTGNLYCRHGVWVGTVPFCQLFG